MKPRAAPPEQRTREVFFALGGPHVRRLSPFVRHVLGYHEAVGDLLPGELSADEVVDAVPIRAYQEFVSRPPRRTLKSGLSLRGSSSRARWRG
jgi:hypothetical protein